MRRDAHSSVLFSVPSPLSLEQETSILSVPQKNLSPLWFFERRFERTQRDVNLSWFPKLRGKRISGFLPFSDGNGCNCQLQGWEENNAGSKGQKRSFKILSNDELESGGQH